MIRPGSAGNGSAALANVLLGAAEPGERLPTSWPREQTDCPVLAAIRRDGARFSVTARHSPAGVRAIAGIDPTAWSPIHYPNAVFDEDEQRWISDAEVAEVPFTAFTSRRSGEQITARLIMRRVRRLNPVSARGHEQDELFAAYYGVFTDSPLGMLAAEADHRGHAVIEQVIADLKDSALAHLPSVILSPRCGQGADLQVCVVDSVLDAALAPCDSAWADEFRVVSSGRVAA